MEQPQPRPLLLWAWRGRGAWQEGGMAEEGAWQGRGVVGRWAWWGEEGRGELLAVPGLALYMTLHRMNYTCACTRCRY